MTKIAIIGNAGGGKSTISRRLRDRLKLPLVSIDHMQWKPGWTRVPADEFAEAHARVLREKGWIIDGWGDSSAIEERFRQADTIVLVDYPLWRHYFWTVKRQIGCLFHARIDEPPGCSMLPMTWPLLKMIWSTEKNAMPRLRQQMTALKSQKRVFRIRTKRDLRNFFNESECYVVRSP